MEVDSVEFHLQSSTADQLTLVSPLYIQENDNSWIREKELKHVTNLKLPEQDEDILTRELKTQLNATVLLTDADETSIQDKPQEDVITTSSKRSVSEATNEVSPLNVTSKNKVKDNCVGPYGIYQALHRYSNFNTTLNQGRTSKLKVGVQTGGASVKVGVQIANFSQKSIKFAVKSIQCSGKYDILSKF